MQVEISTKKLKRFGLILLSLIFFITIFTLYTLRDSDNISKVKATLQEEFNNSYPDKRKANGDTVEIDMTADESEVEIVEGYKTKVWSYNGQVPGPEIRLKLGDTLRVRFKNDLSQETTIHWHGVRVENAMDGVPDVTQDPIQPGDEFTYEFTPKDAGTFWFHPHVRGSEQVERGLFGTLVVEDEHSGKYTTDKVWVIDDWRLEEDASIYPQFNTRHDLAHDGRWGNLITVNAHTSEVLELSRGSRTLLRLVNTSNARVYKLDFDELNVKAIAVDGMYVSEPFDPNGFELAPGNRLDLDIQIPQETEDNTFIITDRYTNTVNTLGTIKVTDEQVDMPTFEYPVNDNIPNWEEASQIPADLNYKLDAVAGGTYGISWTMNGEAFPNVTKPTLNSGEFYKIRFQNESYRLHPMHLHGQFFKVISRNGKSVDEGHWRDTVLVHPQETVEIGLIPLDKGNWLNHCHILEHAEAGMMTLFEVD